MIPILYENNETAFTSNGLGRLRDCISAVVTEERNSIYELDFQYPVDGANFDLIKCGRIVGVVHNDSDDVQPFDIVSMTRPINGIVTFHCVHVSYRQSKLTVSGTNINSLAGALAMLKNAQPSNPFNYWTNMNSTGLFPAADGVPRSVRQMLGGMEGSILDTYGGEYEWDKWTVKLWGARGQVLDLTIRYGLNLMAYDEEIDYSETYTACIPFWVGGDNSDIVVKGNKVSTGVVPYDGREACIPLNLTDKFESQPTAQQLENLAANLMNTGRVFLPTQSITVEFARLQDSEDYTSYADLMQCGLCDSINVVFPMYETSARFKIVKTVYDVLAERFTKMELGSLSKTLSDALGINGGNSPSVSDVRMVQAAADAQTTADYANGILAGMEAAATAADTTLNGIYATATAASDTLADMQDAATAAHTTLTDIYQDAADAAQSASDAQTAASNAQTAAGNAVTAAGNALTAAQNAQGSANAALASLSNVEDVVGVLEWITAHGTMTANGSTALDPSKVYFVRDNSGDYHVGSYYYSIIAEPKAEDRTSYYTLSIDESVQNYVAAHVVVDTEGLWLIPDSGGNKVLIATGAGSSYTTAGTYIIGKVNGIDTVFAKFTTDGATMNATNSTQIAHLGYGVGTAQSGTATAPYYTLGTREVGSKVPRAYSSSSTYRVGDLVKYNGDTYVCRTAITTPEAWNSNHWQPLIGNYSIAEGEYLIASGVNSHAEGRYTEANGYCSHAEGGPQGSPIDGPVANGDCSHAEGNDTKANGEASHAEGGSTVANGNWSHTQNLHTIANGDDQTALGKYNVADTTSAVIIGNGTADNARSNALTVDWNGNVDIASGAKYKINGSNLSASDVGALPISGGTMTGQLLTSYKTSVAMGSYGSAQTTVPNLVEEVRFSSGCSGSVSIGTAYTSNNVTIATGWYNFMYMPHRSGGVNGSASGDNCNYGNLFLFGMNNTNGRYIVRVSSGSIAEVAKIYTSIERYTRASAGTLDWSSTAEGDNKVIMKSALAFWNGAYSGTSSTLKYSANGEIIGTNTSLGKKTWTPISGSSYSNYGGCYYEKYGRVVHVHVGVSGLTANTATVIYTLPSGYRPSTTVFAHGTGGSWNNIGYVEIYADGRISVRSQGAYCGADITYLV